MPGAKSSARAKTAACISPPRGLTPRTSTSRSAAPAVPVTDTTDRTNAIRHARNVLAGAGCDGEGFVGEADLAQPAIRTPVTATASRRYIEASPRQHDCK